MTGFVLGVMIGAAIASALLYSVYLWAHPDDRPEEQVRGSTTPKRTGPASKQIANLATHETKASPTAPTAVAEVALTPPVAADAEPPADKAPARKEAAPSTGESPLPPAEVQWFGELSHRIEGEIGSHSYRIQEISASLREAKEGEPEAVLDAASRIMLANQQLQAELAAARVEITEHRQKVKELAAEARTDPLTGLANRRAFGEDLGRRIEQWRRHKVPLSMVMVDIDHFKSINDRYTHAGGDTALQHMGDLLRGALREMDVPVRYGGEEFAVILPGTKLPEALQVAERLRATIASRGFLFEGQTIAMTASLGVATAVADDNSTTIVERADAALYAAKQAGRNRAYVHDGSSRQPIGADKAVVRHPFRDLQKIAPYKVGGRLPNASEFYPVRCYDLSVKGISFLSPTPPDFQALIVRLGNPPDARYMISSIAHVAPMQCGDEQVYRVGCTFVSRLDSDEIHPGVGEVDAEPQVAGV